MEDFTDLLLSKGIVSLDQLSEAEEVVENAGEDIGDVLIQMEYATPEEVAENLAEFHKLPYVDLRVVNIEEDIIELVPESVARENTVLPYEEIDGTLRVLIADPFDLETIEKLRFILNRKIDSVLAPKTSILGAINRYYGQVEGESADSMLQEFTDTAIDFTETDEGGEAEGGDEDENNDAPVIRLVNLMIQEAVQVASVRHSHRTVRGACANSLSDRWSVRGT